MRSILLALLLIVGQPVFSQGFTVEEMTFKNDTLTLVADILIPANPGREKTGIAIIQGSGNSGRSNGWSRSFAEFLAANGYYVLLPDKRGSGKSGGSWKTSSFEQLADDAIASVKHLRNIHHLQKVGVMGLSQGGLIAPLVAVKDTSVNFVINIVGTSVTLEEQVIHEVMNTARKEGLNPNEIKQVMDLHVLMLDYAMNRRWDKLGLRLKELENATWAKFAKTFPGAPDMWVWDWIKMNIKFDPMKYWMKVKQDVFVAYGSKDQDDNMPVYESVFRLQKGFYNSNKTNYVVNVYKTGHAMYEDDKAELRKEFLDDLLKWIQKR